MLNILIQAKNTACAAKVRQGAWQKVLTVNA